MVGVDEPWIGDLRVLVLAGSLSPVVQALPGEHDGLAAGVEVEVVVELDVLSVQLPARSWPAVPVDDVALEGEREMRLDARPLQLAVHC